MVTVTGESLAHIIQIRNPTFAQLQVTRSNFSENIGQKIVSHMLIKALIVFAYAETVFALVAYVVSLVSADIPSQNVARNYLDNCVYDFFRSITAIFKNIFYRTIAVNACPLVDKVIRIVRSTYQNLEIQQSINMLQRNIENIGNQLTVENFERMCRSFCGNLS